jgi:thiamine kinase-like enzyme
MPASRSHQDAYIRRVIKEISNLEGAVFKDSDVKRMSLQPYFRDKLSDVVVFNEFCQSVQVQEKLIRKLQQATASIAPEESINHMIQQFRVKLQNDITALFSDIRNSMQELGRQPNNAFGHCDMRPDNIAYHAQSDRVILVDWNWASQTPRGFGATEFFGRVRKQWRRHNGPYQQDE